ncbi:MFS transporter [Pseudomonas sp. GNP013]|uniref:MFS transporter n=1 Tax=unclassified Pseudomonas TaxID=196821 RepID=UPI001E507D8B|nr:MULTISPECIES: MFS transporter [unclassified Pseudomonas]MEB0106259.1 MFS transporter [Pseudomonas sp. MH9.3]WPX78576.1 MFS transporter [Pseudomonas sp. MH9.3]WQG58961.1 MFS transporter [Pseudomonas sp. RTB3]
MNSDTSMSRGVLALYCLATGFSVAAVVYHQSMTFLIAASFGLPVDALWSLSLATQLGYGAGLVLCLPLGDVHPPRVLIPGALLLLGVTLLLLSVAPTLTVVIVLCAVAGVLSVGGQLLIAHCARTCLPTERAAVIGSLLSSLFAGLLLARVLAGWGGEVVGWRGMYLVVGMLTMTLGLLIRAHLRIVPPSEPIGYGVILIRQYRLWMAHAPLRRLALIAACFFAASNGIWANLGSLTHTTLQWSTAQTGLLAFTSLAALRSPMLADYLQRKMRWQAVVMLLGTGLMLVSLAGALMGAHVVMIVVFLVVADIAVRSVQALTQSRVLAINPAAASRLNSLYMTVFFLGAAVGSWLGGVAVHHLGWLGMYLFPLFCTLAGLGLLVFSGHDESDPTLSPVLPQQPRP